MTGETIRDLTAHYAEKRARSFVTLRFIEAPLVEVYRAWTDPDLLKEWLKTPAQEYVSYEHSVDIGGVLSYQLEQNGTQYGEIDFECVEHIPYRLLRFQSPMSCNAVCIQQIYYITASFEPVIDMEGTEKNLYKLSLHTADANDIEHFASTSILGFWDDSMRRFEAHIKARRNVFADSTKQSQLS